MSEVKARLANLPEDQRSELLARLAARTQRGRAGRFPLSSPQERLWFLHQAGTDTAAYNIPTALRIRGPLNIESLEGAFCEVTRRHGILRTHFELEESTGIPQQVVLPWKPSNFRITDLASLGPAAREHEAARLTSEEARVPFDLAAGPLVRARLLRLGLDDHILVLTMHHIVSDGWSQSVLASELVALYDTWSRGVASTLAELPIQYADYALWQRKSLDGDLVEAQICYWRDVLRGPLPVLDLPTRRPRPTAKQTSTGSQLTQQVGRELAADLRRLSYSEDATLFMTLLAAFKCLLNRYTAQEDIVVGSPIANRSQRQVESLIGLFINIMVLRTDLSGNPPFSRLLGRVKETALGAYANQDAPLETLVEELVPPRDAGRTSLFEVMFALQNAPRFEARLGNLSILPLTLESGSAKFELTVSMLETDEGMTAVWEYDRGLFDEQTIQRMIGHYDRLLAAIVLDPAKRISRLEMLSKQEIEQLLAMSRPAAFVDKRRGLLHRLLEAQVEGSPDAVALVSSEGHVTYSELNERANRVGHHLGALGIGPESRVGVWIERTSSLIIALVGVLKAGAAYVPLDPAYPEQRVSYVIGDAGIGLLLTEYQLSSSAPGLKIKTICMDTDWASVDLEPARNLDVPDLASNMAYVIYTSGSTGKPKGVAISHEQVVRLFGSTEHWYGFDEKDVWTLFHSSAFDFSVWEIWGALLFGGRLVIVPYLFTRTPEAFYELVCDERVTVLNQTPSAFRQFIQVEESGGHSSSLALKHVIFGGEALDPTSLKPWFERHPADMPRLINMYGITETTVHVTYRPLTVADLVRSHASLIGQPIPDLSLYVAGRDTDLVPLEVPGEVYVGGAGLARGYLNNPGLTAERFIPDPFSSMSGGRLYRAGDLSRLMPDGDREYLGRVDHQVKIRGFRIELGEIEASLSRHRRVKRAVVTTAIVTTNDAAGEARLVAYLIAGPENAPPVSELRAFLKETLPDYMIPSWFVYVDAFPLTTNGKLDRRALPDPGEALKPDKEKVAPRDILELEIGRVWEEILGAGPVGVTDDFFELGGHSLMAVRLTSRLRSKLNVDIPLSALIQGGSIESLACMLRAWQQFRSDSPLVPLQTRGECAPFFCVHPIGGNVLCYVELSRHLGNDHPFYGLQSRGLNAPIHGEISVEEMAAEYIEALRVIQPNGPYRLGGWSFGGVVAAEMARQLEKQADQIELLVLIDSRAPGLDSDAVYSRSEEDAMELVSAFLADFSGVSGKELVGKELLEASTAMEMPVEELFRVILVRAREQHAVAPSVDVSQIGRLFEVYRRNLRAARRYKPFLKSLPRQTVLVRSADSDEAGRQSSTLGWEAFASRPLILRDMQATHYDMLREPRVAMLARILREFI